MASQVFFGPESPVSGIIQNSLPMFITLVLGIGHQISLCAEVLIEPESNVPRQQFLVYSSFECKAELAPPWESGILSAQTEPKQAVDCSEKAQFNSFQLAEWERLLQNDLNK